MSFGFSGPHPDGQPCGSVTNRTLPPRNLRRAEPGPKSPVDNRGEHYRSLSGRSERRGGHRRHPDRVAAAVEPVGPLPGPDECLGSVSSPGCQRRKSPGRLSRRAPWPGPRRRTIPARTSHPATSEAIHRLSLLNRGRPVHRAPGPTHRILRGRAPASGRPLGAGSPVLLLDLHVVRARARGSPSDSELASRRRA